MSNRDEIIEAMARGICESRLWPGAWNSRTDFEGERRALIEDAAAALAAFKAVVLSRNHNELIARLRSPTFGTETSVAAANAIEAAEARAVEAEQTAHYANGVAELAMKHRDDAEHQLAAAMVALRQVKCAHPDCWAEDIARAVLAGEKP